MGWQQQDTILTKIDTKNWQTLSRNKPIHSTVPNKTLTTPNNRCFIIHLFLRLNFLLLLLYPCLQHRNLDTSDLGYRGCGITLRVCSLMVLIMYGMAKSINFALHPNSITTSGFTRSEQLLVSKCRLGGCTWITLRQTLPCFRYQRNSATSSPWL